MLENEAHAALAAMRDTKGRMAGLAECPPWRHAAFGAVMGLLVLSVAFPPALQAAMTAIAVVGVGLIVRDDKRRFGVFINGYRSGATRPFTFGLLAAVLLLSGLQFWLKDRGAAWWPYVVALAAFAIATLASMQWSRIFRREMERGL